MYSCYVVQLAVVLRPGEDKKKQGKASRASAVPAPDADDENRAQWLGPAGATRQFKKPSANDVGFDTGAGAARAARVNKSARHLLK